MASADRAAGGMAMVADRFVGIVAILGGAAGVISTASIAAFFAVGGPFGAINDWTVGLLGLLSGVIALGLGGRDGITRAATAVPIAFAVVGSAVAVVGSYLVISDTTGFLLAGLVESLGFALIGIWLIAVSRSMLVTAPWPPRMARLGMATGLVLAIGFGLIPAIAMGLDDAAAAPAWVWVGFLGWLAIFFLLPVWCLWLGITARRETAIEP